MNKLKTALLVMGMGAVGLTAYGDGSWTGASNNDWNVLANWSANPAGAAAGVNTLDNFPVITTNNTIIPNDINIGTVNGTTGRVDVVSGTLNYVYWSRIGDGNGKGTLNIADTSSSGGTYTGYGLGSGSYVSQNAAGNAQLYIGTYQSTGILNMNTTGHLDAQYIYISSAGQAGSSGTFNLDNGTVNASRDLEVGSLRSGANVGGIAAMNISGGTVNVGQQFYTGRSGTGTTTQTGGSVTAGTYMVVGIANGSVGTYNLSGGTATQNGVSQITTIGAGTGSQGTMNVSGNGTYTSRGDLVVGESGNGTLNISGDATVVSANNKWTHVAQKAGSTGTINLDGGTFNVRHIQQGVGNPGNIYLNGGTLQVNSAENDLITGVNTYVKAGGAVIDTAGFNKTMGVALQEDSGSTGGGLTKLGDGTLTLGNANTYTGDTDVNAGGLNLTGSIAGNVNVALGASISGNGSIAGNLDLASGAMLAFNTNNTLSVAGTLSLANSFSVDSLGIADWNSVTDGTYVLFNAFGDFSNIQNFGEANAYDIDGTRSAYFQNGSLQLVVIPEPAALGLIGFAGASMLFVRRRLMM